MKLLKNSVEIKTEKLESSIDKIKAVVLIEIKVLVKYEDFMTIVLSEIWGNGPRSILCKKYVFEYIQMIEKIVENGINKKEIMYINSTSQKRSRSCMERTISSLG